MNKLKQIIMKDIGWKILSVIIAIGLWFVVINIQNPVENRSFNVLVEFQNKDALIESGLVMVNNDDFTNLKVNVKVRGQRISLDRLNSKNIEAIVDLKKIVSSGTGSKEFSIPITVSLPGIVGDTCQITSRDPQYVNIVVDNVITKEKNINVKVSGSVQSGLVMGEISLNPYKIKVSGAETDVDQVTEVRVEVAVDNLSKDTVLKAVPVAYDASGAKMAGVVLSQREIEVTIPVSNSKKIPVKVMTQGAPAYHYKVLNTTWTPEYIEVVGEDEALKSISEIALPVVNIQNKTENVEEDYNVSSLLPNGITVKENTENSIHVKVEIMRELTQVFQIPSTQITTTGVLPDHLKATFKPEDVEITLSGTQDAIGAVDVTKIIGTVDISNLEEGSQIVTINFTLPDGVEMSGTPPTTLIEITNESETQTELPVEEEVVPTPIEEPEETEE